MNIRDQIPKRIDEIDWPKAYEYKALMDAERVLLAEIHRRRGAKMLVNGFVRDPSDVHFEALHREIYQRMEQLYKEAYMKETVSEETDPDRSGSQTSTDSTGR